MNALSMRAPRLIAPNVRRSALRLKPHTAGADARRSSYPLDAPATHDKLTPVQSAPVDWDAASSSVELADCDIEVVEVDVSELDVDLEDLRATSELAVVRLDAIERAALAEQPPPISVRAPIQPVRPPIIPRTEPTPLPPLERSDKVDPASARYVVTPGARPGELVLRALEPGEPPPFGVPVAKLSPSCDLDRRCIATMLNR